MSENCNANAITDLGSSVNIIYSAIECASLNVYVNLKSTSEESSETNVRVEEILSYSKKIKIDMYEIVEARM